MERDLRDVYDWFNSVCWFPLSKRWVRMYGNCLTYDIVKHSFCTRKTQQLKRALRFPPKWLLLSQKKIARILYQKNSLRFSFKILFFTPTEQQVLLDYLLNVIRKHTKRPPPLSQFFSFDHEKPRSLFFQSGNLSFWHPHDRKDWALSSFFIWADK